jgi:hypothetical protein
MRSAVRGTIIAISASCALLAPSAYGALAAPDTPAGAAAAGDPACTYPDSTVGTPHVQPYIHCYTPAQIRSAYGVDGVAEQGAGQTIVLVDAYGAPTGAHDLQVFHDTFFPGEPDPNYTAVYPYGKPDFNSGGGNGQSGPPTAAAGQARRRSTSSGPTPSRRTRTSSWSASRPRRPRACRACRTSSRPSASRSTSGRPAPCPR